MITLLIFLVLILAAALAILFVFKRRAENANAGLRWQVDAAYKMRDEEIDRVQKEAQAAISSAEISFQGKVAEYEAETERRREADRVAMSEVNQAFEQRTAEIERYADQVREHYENESRKVFDVANEQLAQALAELEPLRAYSSLRNAENEVKATLSSALAEANAMRDEARTLLEQARSVSTEERQAARQRAKEIRDRAETVLTQATNDAGRIVLEAERRAEGIAGEAYVALRDKGVLEEAVRALWNVVEGYGDRYIIPTRSLLDDLARDFGHTEAGEALRSTREHSRRMVEQRQAATCNYEEVDRRERANRFVVDAFNGRVDAILSRTKHDNYGTLDQEIRDAFSLVNLNGVAFRDARILPAYRDARLAELKWAVVVQELKLKARQEQREIQEQMREEEKIRRERERAIQEAEKEEEMRRQAREAVQKQMDDTILELKGKLERANEDQKAQLEREYQEQMTKLAGQLEEKEEQLRKAEEEKARAISNAQKTRAGNVYIISNIGSFGDEVVKIGMTRRDDPFDRVWELSGAAVPFDFDVHAMIYSEDAPSLERMLHDAFDDLRVNKVNFRKEFFRIPLQQIRTLVAEKNLEATFTMAAEAREYRETLAIGRMDPEARERYRLQRHRIDAGEE